MLLGSAVQLAEAIRAGLRSPLPRLEFIERSNLMSLFERFADAEQWKNEALCTRAFNKWIADMDRDELLALIGWLSQKIRKIEGDVKNLTQRVGA